MDAEPLVSIHITEIAGSGTSTSRQQFLAIQQDK